MFKTVVLCCALLFSSSLFTQTPASATTRSSVVTIQVRDPLGAVISKAFVLFHSDALERDNPKPFHLELRTDAVGETKTTLPAGFYDVFVASNGFAPWCQKFRVRDGQPRVVRIAMPVDKLMSREYGDQFDPANPDPIVH